MLYSVIMRWSWYSAHVQAFSLQFIRLRMVLAALSPCRVSNGFAIPSDVVDGFNVSINARGACGRSVFHVVVVVLVLCCCGAV